VDSLKALLQKKKQEKQELVGDKKYVRKGELEEAKLKRIREEEQQELKAKVSCMLLLGHWARTAMAGSSNIAPAAASGASIAQASYQHRWQQYACVPYAAQEMWCHCCFVAHHYTTATCC
jgi:hypothetical protein